MRGAMWQGRRLQRAQRMGCRMPATAGPDDLQGHVDAAECIVEGLATTVAGEVMMAAIEAVAGLSCQFQGYIAKQYELRVSVIGRRVFAAKVVGLPQRMICINIR